MIGSIETGKQRSSRGTSGDEILTRDRIGNQCENETTKCPKKALKKTKQRMGLETKCRPTYIPWENFRKPQRDQSGSNKGKEKS